MLIFTRTRNCLLIVFLGALHISENKQQESGIGKCRELVKLWRR
jgi:hypothetical protein